ncbi:MAG: 30S ribosomal protein S2 [bacterium]|nr:30S ribosomal protein S2 [bacterium]
MPAVSVEALLESGAHFGHLTRRWNPKMRTFIFMERNGIHIIDLRKTQLLIDIAREAAFETSTQGRGVLFVGTKNQAKGPIEAEAKRSLSNYVSERWLGGMLTNFSTIRKSIKRLGSIDKMEVDGTFEKITKKERLMLGRERDRLRKVFGGIEEMTRLPGLIFVVDIKREHIAIKEARILGIPVIGVVDTNSDPEDVDFPIPANDDSIRTIEIILKVMSDAIIEGKEIAKVRTADISASTEQSAKQTEGGDQVQRQLRARKGGPAAKAENDNNPK